MSIGEHVRHYQAQKQVKAARVQQQAEQRRARDACTRETFAYFRAQQQLRIKKWLARAELRRHGLNKRGEPYTQWSKGSGGSTLPWHDCGSEGRYDCPQDRHIVLRGNCRGRF